MAERELVSALLGMNLSPAPVIWFQSRQLDSVDQVELAAESFLEISPSNFQGFAWPGVSKRRL